MPACSYPINISYEKSAQIWKGDLRTPIPVHLMVSSAMELQLGLFRFLQPHTGKQTQTKCLHNLHAPCSISHMFIFMLRLQVHTHLTNYSYFDCGKLEYPQLEPHAWLKIAQVLGPPVNICGNVRCLCISVRMILLTHLCIDGLAQVYPQTGNTVSYCLFDYGNTEK